MNKTITISDVESAEETVEDLIHRLSEVLPEAHHDEHEAEEEDHADHDHHEEDEHAHHEEEDHAHHEEGHDEHHSDKVGQIVVFFCRLRRGVK